MVKVTILGAGITGMAIASQLPRDYEVTIVARNLPGDPDSTEWASPWAGAVFMGMDGSNLREQRMQLDAFASRWKIALNNPESSVRRVEMHDLMDFTPLEKVWYRDHLPGFHILSKDELPAGAPFGMAYQTIVLNPGVFLPWMRARLEKTGVKFLRMTVQSLSNLCGLGHDYLINAAGIGPRYLRNVMDQKVQEVRGQTILVKSDFDKIWIRRGKDYTYALGRQDGTTVLGGIKQFDNKVTSVDGELRNDIFRRIHENLPEAFPSADPLAFTVLRDIVGIRPQREGGLRIEKEILDGQKVVHAYGVAGGGYIFSWGLAREVCHLVEQFHFTSSNTFEPLVAVVKL
ncbi:uncharacterized protein N7483_012472 [Penicillium malachiteum]|uniref:uncharacterized protein n=1 Tax=Penicillium malachiteum TaxID=1324776 RepID=UPI002548C359|nr:uncharacterized protein N7483_012472 [Penicillium malachiteum]KAJ5715291.1 hypothetical protein N7483_012472 [Penicillium malachiteum]